MTRIARVILIYSEQAFGIKAFEVPAQDLAMQGGFMTILVSSKLSHVLTAFPRNPEVDSQVLTTEGKAPEGRALVAGKAPRVAEKVRDGAEPMEGATRLGIRPEAANR